MTYLLILAFAVLQLGDPVADAIGDGSLAPPTAPVYATTSNFDLQGVVLTEDVNLTLHVTLGALDNPGGLPFGFSNPVLEVYLDSAPGGAEALLPGSNMRMPQGQGWETAIRLTGDEAFLVTAQPDGEPGDWPVTPVTVTADATTLIVRAPVPRPRRADLYAISGVYDAFASDAWRPISRTPTPWSFSSPTQSLPVVDVMAPSQTDQIRSLHSGVLPKPKSATYGVGWLALMLAGIAAAVVGIVFRRRAGTRQGQAPVGTSSDPYPLPRPVGHGATAAVATPVIGMSRSGGTMVARDATATSAPTADSRAADAAAGGPVGSWQDVLVQADATPLHASGSAPAGPAEHAVGSDHDGTALTADSDAAQARPAGVSALPESRSESLSIVLLGDSTEASTAVERESTALEGESTALDGESTAAEGGSDDVSTGGTASPRRIGLRPPVPIVPLPQNPPKRRGSTEPAASAAGHEPAAPEPGDHEAPDHSGAEDLQAGAEDPQVGAGDPRAGAGDPPSGAGGPRAGAADPHAGAELPGERAEPGWRSVLVDPHDSFLDEDVEGVLWPRADTGVEADIGAFEPDGAPPHAPSREDRNRDGEATSDGVRATADTDPKKRPDDS